MSCNKNISPVFLPSPARGESFKSPSLDGRVGRGVFVAEFKQVTTDPCQPRIKSNGES